MSHKLNLIEYEVIGEGQHSKIKIFVAGLYCLTLDTYTKYVEDAEEELCHNVRHLLRKVLKDDKIFRIVENEDNEVEK